MGRAPRTVLATISFTGSTAPHNQILQVLPGDEAHSFAEHLFWGPMMFAEL